MNALYRRPAACCWAFLLVAAACDASIRTTTVFRRMKQESFDGYMERPRGHRYLNSPVLATDSCQAVQWNQSLVVAARLDEDVSWMATDLVPWQHFLVYAIKGEGDATHKIQHDTGRESQAYLRFIYDYYDCLPQVTVFIHAHRSSQHSPDIVTDLKRLQWQTIPGFLGMNRPQRTNTFYFLESYKQKPDPKDTSETAHWTQFAYEQNLLIQQHWRELFHEELGEMPITLTAAAGGQFAATKKSLTRHPRKFYQKLLRWLESTDVDGFWAGLIFEQMWSYILGAGVDYQHPPECTVFLCDQDGHPVTPRWEVLFSQRAAMPRTSQ